MLVWSILMIATAAHADEPPADRFAPVIDRLVKAINAQDFPAIFQEFDANMQTALPLPKTQEFFKNLHEGLGKIMSLGPRRSTEPGMVICPANFQRGVLDMTVSLDSNNKINGLWFRPPAKKRTGPPQKNKTPLALPFKGGGSPSGAATRLS